MGQKVNPIGIRLGIVKNWQSNWYVGNKNYADFIWSDYQVRKFLNKTLSQASISSILIERPAKNAIVKVISARPGLIIGKKR